MTRKKSKNSSKTPSKKPNNNHNNNHNNNEIYNYICIGVIVIIIIYFICKEQLNKNEGFARKDPKVDKYYNFLKEIDDLQNDLQNDIMSDELDFADETSYNNFLQKYNKLNYDFSALQVLSKSICSRYSCLKLKQKENALKENIDNIEEHKIKFEFEFERRKNAITKNQYKPSDYEKNAIRILGNNSNHFSFFLIGLAFL